MNNYKDHLISENKTVRDALAMLDKLAEDAVLFAVDDEHRLKGSLTDGDVRRGLLKGLQIENKITDFIQARPKFFRKSKYNIDDVIDYRSRNFKIVPVLDDEDRIINIVNFRFVKSYLPLDAVIMAGGRGERLKPLTDTVPKPLLHVGSKPIIGHNVDRLMTFGVDDFWICVRYLGEMIEEHYRVHPPKYGSIEFVTERNALGTIGALTLIDNFRHDHVLVMNSDLLTDINFEDFYLDFTNNDADLSVASIPYSVSVPYAVLETSDGKVVSLKEKPMYTYYSNAGIYLMKRRVLQDIPANSFYNATDLMEHLIASGKKVISYPLNGYWLDIGRKEDYAKAQEDIKKLKL
jgi:dTDP-glucose pyrophosphorylase